MEALLLRSHSTSDIELIMALAQKLGIEAQKINDSNKELSVSNSTEAKSEHDFFDSFGLWKNREIDAKTLRNEAWKIQE